MGIFSFNKDKAVKGYKGIKRTGPKVLNLARQAIYDHLVQIVDQGDMDEADVGPHIKQCLAQLASWPEAMAITYLLRDLDHEDFFNA